MDSNLELRRLLLRLPKTGKQFEELVCAALEQLLGQRVRSARSGSQFGADMGTGQHDGLFIRCEAKRYGEQTNLSERELLGEISQALQKNPGLDLWILATTKEVDETLESALTREGRMRGLGIEILDLSASTYSKLPRLLAVAREAVCNLFEHFRGGSEARELHSVLESIAERYGSDDQLRDRLIEARNQFDLVADQARSELQRLTQSPSRARAKLSQAVSGPEVVERSSANQALARWHSDSRDSLFVLLGDEGVGKTWVVYAWLASKCAQERLLPIAVPSSRGRSFKALFSGLASYLADLFPDTDESHWRRRVARWFKVPALRDRFLIVVDGINEEPTIKWRPILNQLFQEDEPSLSALASQEETSPRTIVPTITTCRTSYWKRKFSDLSAWPVEEFELEPFSHDELRTYLRRHDSRPEDFSREIWDLLRIPRFCDRVVNHYDRLMESGDLTVDGLLYEDWLDRYQRKEDLTFDNSSFQALMMDLAKRALKNKTRHRDRKLLDRLPNKDGEKILEELKTGGIFVTTDDGKSKVHPVRLHHALGLLLLRRLTKNDGASDDELQEVLAEHVEGSGDDAHAAICAAAIFGATLQKTSERVIRMLFEQFFSLQNIQEGLWVQLRAYFPAFPEVYSKIAEHLAACPELPRKPWEVVTSAYLRWGDDLTLRSIIDRHCHRWLSLLPLDSPWRGNNPDESQTRHKERLRCLFGSEADIESPGLRKTEGVELELVDWKHLGRLQNLAVETLTARPTTVDSELLRNWALTFSTQQYAGRDQAVWWIVKFLENENRSQLATQVNAMLEVDNTMWQEAAHHLAWYLPDVDGKRLKDRSSFGHPRWTSELEPCSRAIFWDDDRYCQCLPQANVETWVKAEKLARRAIDPTFDLPTECADELKAQLVELLHGIDRNELHRSSMTRERHDLESWAATFARWIPREVAIYEKQLVQTIVRADLDEEDEEERRRERAGVEYRSRDLESISMLLDESDYEALRKFWDAWNRQPPEGRKNVTVSDEAFDLLEANLFRILLLIAERGQQVDLILERPVGGYNLSSLIDVLPLDLSRTQLVGLWGQLFERSNEELVAKMTFPVLNEVSLSDLQRERIAELAQTIDEADRLASLLALLSKDCRLVELLIARDVRIDFEFFWGRHRIEVEAIPPEISLKQLESLMALPLLSYVIEHRQDPAETIRFAQLFQSFVEQRAREWHPHFPNPRSVGYWSFSYPAICRALRDNPECLDYLLQRLYKLEPHSPVKHSFRLYVAVCRYLFEYSPDQAVQLADHLVNERYIDENDFAEPHVVISLLGRFSESSAVSERLIDCLNLCVTDSSLQSFALSIGVENDSWFWRQIQDDVDSERPILVARGLTLAGFAHDTERAIALLEDAAPRTDWWLDTVRKDSLATARRAHWAKHWFSEFLVRKDWAESWAAFRLFVKCADRRYYTWVDRLLAKHVFSWRDGTRKMKHLLANHQRIDKAIEEREKKMLLGHFCHSKVEESAFPWKKEWRLSPQERRAIISGSSATHIT